MGWMGHEKGILSGLKQAMWFVIGAPIRLVYWPVVKIMDRFKKDEDKAKEPLRLAYIDQPAEGQAAEEGCIKYVKDHDDHLVGLWNGSKYESSLLSWDQFGGSATRTKKYYWQKTENAKIQLREKDTNGKIVGKKDTRTIEIYTPI